MLIHNISVCEDYMAPIYDAELYLMSTCKEYNIDYATCECKELHVAEEGVFSRIAAFVKEVFQKAISVLVKIWKAIVGAVKSLITRAVEFFKRVFKIGRKDVAVKSGIITKPGHIEKGKTFKTTSEIVSTFKTANAAFANEINKLQQQNINIMKQSEQSATRSITKLECFCPIFEKAVYNDNLYVQSDLKGTSSSFFTDDDRKAYIAALDDAILKGQYAGTTLAEQAKDRISHFAISNLQALDTRMMETIIESGNICEGYQALILNSLHNLVEHAKKVVNDKEVKTANLYRDQMQGLLNNIEALKNGGYTEAMIKEFLYNQFGASVKVNSTPEEVKKQLQQWIQLRINWNRGIIVALQRMIANNQELLGITTQKAELIAKELESGKTDSVRRLLDANRDKIITDFGVDARKLGLGVICIADDIKFDGEVKHSGSNVYEGWWNAVTDFKHNDQAITYLTKYDVTVVAHGNDFEGKWVMEITKWPNGSKPKPVADNAQSVDDFVEGLIKQGFKRINIVSCNPGGHKLSEEIQNSKKVLIRMSLTNTLIS